MQKTKASKIFNRSRRSMMPIWVKFIAIGFMLIGLLTIIAFVGGLIGFKVPLSIYGFWAEGYFNPFGGFILTLFLLISISGFMLWFGHEDAIKLIIFNCIAGVLLCIFTGFIYPFIDSNNSTHLTFRIEILILLIILKWSFKTKNKWEKFIPNP